MKKLHKSFDSRKETVETMNAACRDLICYCSEDCVDFYHYTGVPTYNMTQAQYDVAWQYYN